MKVILEHVHFIPTWISNPSKFLNPNSSHLLNLPQKYLFSALFYGLFVVFKRNNIFIQSVWVLIYFTLITIQSAAVWDSSLADYDPTNQNNDILTNGIFSLAFKYELGIRVINLYTEYAHLMPAFHSGSLDGEFMWATLLHSHSLKDLYSWIWWKYLNIFLNSVGICIGVIMGKNVISRFFKLLGLLCHWTRKLNLLYAIVSGIYVPWLLWLPDLTVLLSAFLFDLGLFLGFSSEDEKFLKKKRKKKTISNRIYHTRSALKNPSMAVNNFANSLFKK